MPLTIGTGRALLATNAALALGLAPQLISSATGNNTLAGGTAFTVPAPLGIVPGNLLLTILSSGGETYTAPVGWTSAASKAASGNSPQINVYTKIATPFETPTYAWTCNNGAADAVNAGVLNIAGASQTTPLNGNFSKYTSTAATTIGTAGTSIPTVLNCLPIAISSIQQLNPSNSGNPTSLTSGWTGEFLAVIIDGGNPGNIGNNNGYNAIYVAAGPITTSVASAVTAGWTWGGASSNFTGTSMMLFVQ